MAKREQRIGLNNELRHYKQKNRHKLETCDGFLVFEAP
jgi:hypothetical protein